MLFEQSRVYPGFVVFTEREMPANARLKPLLLAESVFRNRFIINSPL